MNVISLRGALVGSIKWFSWFFEFLTFTIAWKNFEFLSPRDSQSILYFSLRWLSSKESQLLSYLVNSSSSLWMIGFDGSMLRLLWISISCFFILETLIWGLLRSYCMLHDLRALFTSFNLYRSLYKGYPVMLTSQALLTISWKLVHFIQ